MSLTLIALSAVFLFAILFLKPSGVIYLRQLIIPALCIIFIVCLVLLSETAVKAAVNGLDLWAGVVVPSLFPFFVASELLNSTGIVRTSGILLEPVMRPLFNVPGSASFALVMGATSGYPVGAKITADLKNNGLLTKTEAERLLAFTNNSGPLFITGAVGTGMFGSAKIGILLYLCHFAACIAVGLLFRFYKRSEGKGLKKPEKPHRTNLPRRVEMLREPDRLRPVKMLKNELAKGVPLSASDFGAILGHSVRNSVSAILAIGGFIVLFSVIIELLTVTGVIRTAANIISAFLAPLGIDSGMAKGIINGIFEITKGSRLISQDASAPLGLKLSAVSFIIGWAGISVHFQVISIISKAGIGIRSYLLGKLLHGIVAAVFAGIGLKLSGLEGHVAEPVLGPAGLSASGFPLMLGGSLEILLFTLISFAVLSALAKLLKSKKRNFI